MTARRRTITTSILLNAGCLLALVAGIGTPQALAKGAGSACTQWGDTDPTELTVGQARQAVLCLVNAEREAQNLPALKKNKKLQKAAQRHNDAMVGSGCFSHECPGEQALGDRLEQISYLVGSLANWAVGENVAWGGGDKGTPRSIVDAWMASQGHRANILHRDFDELGVGFSSGTPDSAGASGGIYTTDFGLRVG